MPGIHLYCDLEGGLGRRADLALRAAESLTNQPWTKLKTLISSRGVFLAATYHPSYPVVTFENDEFFICLEGRVYGMSGVSVDSRLAELASSLYPGGVPCISRQLGRIASLVGSMDGDFIIVVQHRASGHITVMNDSLGRLPLFIHENGSRIVLTRELRFITSIIGRGPSTAGTSMSRTTESIEFDRTAIAHYLLLGFIPGERSFISGVHRLEPATITRIGRPEGQLKTEVSIDGMRTFDFGVQANRGKDIEICSADLVDIFNKSASDRASRATASDATNVIGLSGGNDSRCVAASLSGQGISLQAATFIDHFGTAEGDIEIARLLAETTGIGWKLFEPGPASGSDALRLLRLKSGGNFLGQSFSVPLYDAMRREYGEKITYFTGEGGITMTPGTRPYSKIESMQELVEHLIARNSILGPRQVSEIMNIPEGELRDSIGSLLDSYPEHRLADKYTHFIVRERNMRWTLDAEDRNRFWFWSVSPFQSPLFFDYIMGCPEEMKADYRLYRKFLTRLSPQAAAIRNANWNIPIDGKRFRWYMAGRRFYYRMPPMVRAAIRKRMLNTADVLAPYPADSSLMRCFERQVGHCGAIDDHISVSWVKTLLPIIGKHGFDHIFTITSLLEDLLTGRSALEEFLETPLI